MDKACFQRDTAYEDIPKRTASDKILHHKAFIIAKNPKYDEYKRGLASMVNKIFPKKSSGGADTCARSDILTKLDKSAFKSENMSKQQLAEELHKPITRKFQKTKIYSFFKDIVWSDDLADMQLISTCDKGFRFFLCTINIFSKYVWVVPLRDKKGITITNAFQKILD